MQGMVGPSFELYAGTDMSAPPDYFFHKGGMENLTRYYASLYGQPHQPEGGERLRWRVSRARNVEEERGCGEFFRFARVTAGEQNVAVVERDGADSAIGGGQRRERLPAFLRDGVNIRGGQIRNF